MSVRINWIDGKIYVWKCKRHGDDLIGSGHSQGMGMECDPGMMHEGVEGHIDWYPDSSELTCPTDTEEYNRATNEEMDDWEGCQGEWELKE
jgi:hypothetical protein